MYLTNEIAWCAFGVSVSIFLRLCTTLHPYSGQGKPPMYGDYEAQRHWMEITVNLPMNQWYHNSSSNDLNYWGLDYPPLTAYHSYVTGLLAWLINPAFVALHSSHGYESPQHKLFMRYTVLLADILVYIPSVVLFYIASRRTKAPLQCAITLALLYPGLILIDHGHFQYNCISLGLTIVAVALLTIERDLPASVFFVLAVNYKQMELYHAFPFFLYLLSSCIPKPGAPALSGVLKLGQLAVVVLGTFGVLWLPFLLTLEDTVQVVHRLFPIGRGVFEDKVANVWCAVNVFFKLRKLCSAQMLRYCTIATLTALLPSSANLFLSPNIKKFLPALINSSLAFFLFSFQVHEKSILLAAVPVVLYLPERPLPCFWFLYMSSFSMLPLFIKDKLTIAYISLNVFYITAFVYFNFNAQTHNQFGFAFGGKWTRFKSDIRKLAENVLLQTKKKTKEANFLFDLLKIFIADSNTVQAFVVYASIVTSFLGSFLLTAAILIFDPPRAYPDLFTLLIAVYCCVHFVAFFVYFNIVQFNIPQCFDPLMASNFKHSNITVKSLSVKKEKTQ